MIRGLKSLVLSGMLIQMLGPTAHAADIAAGKESYTLCVVCHGANGDGNTAMSAPALAALPGWYIKRQLEAFRDGLRGSAEGDSLGAQMRPIAQLLGTATEDNLIAYIASLPAKAPAVTVTGNVESGKAKYAACAACHGQNAEGSQELGAPPLVGLNDWYLVRQLKGYKAGTRGYHPEDTYGMQMRAMVATLPDDAAIQDVVAYINTLNKK